MYQVDESTNDEIMLSEIPLNIIEESIKSQFDNPEIYRKNDYVQKFLKKYDYSLDNLRDDEEEDIYELHDRFILFIKNIFYDRLNIGFPEIEDYPEDEQHDIIHLTYKFFINGIKKNFVYFIYNILDTDRDLVTQVCEKKKDVISLNFKNEIDNDYDILVLSNLSRIIDFILSQSYTVDEFFKNCEPDSLSVEYVGDKTYTLHIKGEYQNYNDAPMHLCCTDIDNCFHALNTYNIGEPFLNEKFEFDASIHISNNTSMVHIDFNFV